MKTALAAALAAILALPLAAPAALANGSKPVDDLPEDFVVESDEYGETNPEEMTLDRFIQNGRDGKADMIVCSMGYPATKSGAHEEARAIFEACIKAGYTQAMTWMSYLHDNGYGGPEDPDAAAALDRMAAEAGDPVGQFNYGLDLMRGRGVAKDTAEGRRMVDMAAEQGLPVARRMQDSGYDLDEVTPDADEWKYQPLF
ncbi:tetratricopeptide repeat protein [Rhodovulum sp. DZ06]|uniref:tetratricopeptide repeat protein n=1 Tax=Rhodovulum sp. DZ06 TaxID=3425126 RepID=UPI003D34A6AE